MKKARMLVNDDFTGLKKGDLVDVVKESHNEYVNDVLIYKKGIRGHDACTENNVPKVCENEECWYVLPEDIEILPRNIEQRIYRHCQSPKAKKEIKEWLLENATNEAGDVDISGIDFGDRKVIIKEIKYQKAKERIYNDYQKAKEDISNELPFSEYHYTNQELRDELIECEKLLAKSGVNTKEQVRKKLQEIIGEIDDSNQEEESKEGSRGHLF